MKKILSTLVLSLSFAAGAQAADVPYPDLDTYWDNFEAVFYTQEEGIFSGYPDGSFQGTNEINRAELAKVLVLGGGFFESEVAGCATSATRTFSDVPDGEWYTDYVYCAQALDWIQGDDGKDTFRPSDSVNLAEAFKMVTLAREGSPSSSYEGTQWYDLYVNYLKDVWTITGDSSTGFYFRSLNDYLGSVSSAINRADIAELIYRSGYTYEPASIDGRSGGEVYTLKSIEEPAFNLSFTFPGDEDTIWYFEVFTKDPSGYAQGFETNTIFSVYSEEWGEYTSLFHVTAYSPEYYENYLQNDPIIDLDDLVEGPNGIYFGLSCAQDGPDDTLELRSEICNAGGLKGLDFSTGL